MKQIAGWWMPDDEARLQEVLTTPCDPRKRPIIDGRPAQDWISIATALAFCSKRRTAVDIGANVGLWSIWLARFFDRVVAFEPVPAHVRCLARNVAAEDRLTIYAIALGDADGRGEMIASAGNGGRAHVRNVNDAEKGTIVAIEMARLDDFDLRSVDLVKIDVEGYERRVLAGAEQTLRRERPLIVIEQLDWETRYGERHDSALDLLRSWGWREIISDMKGNRFLEFR